VKGRESADEKQEAMLRVGGVEASEDNNPGG